MGTLTISMAIFNSELLVYQRVPILQDTELVLIGGLTCIFPTFSI